MPETSSLLDKLFELIKGQSPAVLHMLKNKMLSLFNVPIIFGFSISDIAGFFGVPDKVEELITNSETVLQKTENTFIELLDKDLKTARQATGTAIAQFFTSKKQSLGVSDAVIAELQKTTTAFAEELYAGGIPKLDNQKRPYDVYTRGIELYNRLFTLLYGNAGNDGGILPDTTPNRKAEAERIAAYISGVHPGEEQSQLSAKFQSKKLTGITGLIAQTASDRGKEGFTAGSLNEANFTITADPTLAAKVANPGVSGGGSQAPAAPGNTPGNTTPTRQATGR